MVLGYVYYIIFRCSSHYDCIAIVISYQHVTPLHIMRCKSWVNASTGHFNTCFEWFREVITGTTWSNTLARAHTVFSCARNGQKRAVPMLMTNHMLRWNLINPILISKKSRQARWFANWRFIGNLIPSDLFHIYLLFVCRLYPQITCLLAIWSEFRSRSFIQMWIIGHISTDRIAHSFLCYWSACKCFT